ANRPHRAGASAGTHVGRAGIARYRCLDSLPRRRLHRGLDALDPHQGRADAGRAVVLRRSQPLFHEERHGAPGQGGFLAIESLARLQAETWRLHGAFAGSMGSGCDEPGAADRGLEVDVLPHSMAGGERQARDLCGRLGGRRETRCRRLVRRSGEVAEGRRRRGRRIQAARRREDRQRTARPGVDHRSPQRTKNAHRPRLSGQRQHLLPFGRRGTAGSGRSVDPSILALAPNKASGGTPAMMPVRSLPVLQNWDCGSCSACCRTYHVPVSAEERKRIEGQGWEREAEMTGVSSFAQDGSWFSGRSFRLNHRADGACVFLGPDNRCRIHAKFGAAAKPLACRIYPFLLVPAGDHWRLGLRYACPSSAANIGQPLADRLPEVREYAAALQSDSPSAVNAPPTALQKGQLVAWSDLLRIAAAVSKVLSDSDVPLERRWRMVLGLVHLCRGLKFDGGRDASKMITGGRLSEMLH